MSRGEDFHSIKVGQMCVQYQQQIAGVAVGCLSFAIEQRQPD